MFWIFHNLSDKTDIHTHIYKQKSHRRVTDVYFIQYIMYIIIFLGEDKALIFIYMYMYIYTMNIIIVYIYIYTHTVYYSKIFKFDNCFVLFVCLFFDYPLSFSCIFPFKLRRDVVTMLSYT